MVTKFDAELLDFEIGNSNAQQIVEALAVLVGLRQWAPRWRKKRLLLRVRSDSISALTALMYCRASGKGTNVIAKELALDIAEAVYRPTVAEHIPGVTNIAADALSRLFVPGKHYEIPACLSYATRVYPPNRGQSYFRAHNAALQLASEGRREQVPVLDG